MSTSYFIGVDWVHEKKLAIYVAPKLNTKPGVSITSIDDWQSIKETDYLNMLFSCFNPNYAIGVNRYFSRLIPNA